MLQIGAHLLCPRTSLKPAAVLHKHQPAFCKKRHGIGNADDFIYIHPLSLIVIKIHGISGGNRFF